MAGRRPPSKPRKFKRHDREAYYAAYWEDELDGEGRVSGRHQRQVPLHADGDPITTPRKADQACDDLHRALMAKWKGEVASWEELEKYKNEYLKHIERPGTCRSYETKLDQLLNYLRENHDVIRFAEIKREYLKGFLTSRRDKVKLVTVHGDLRAIRAFFNEAVRDKKIEENPCRGIKLEKLGRAKASEGFLLPDEMAAIVEFCRRKDEDWYPLFMGFRFAPFRRSELTFLEWDDLDLTRDHIIIRDEKKKYSWKPKRSGRTMDLHPKLKKLIESLDPDSDFVFPSPPGFDSTDVVVERHELGRRAFRKIKEICNALKLEEKDPTGSWKRRFPKGPHLRAFRSGISCELQLKGAPLGYVQAQLGHHDQTLTLEHYTHLVPELMGALTKKFIESLG